MHSGQPPKKPNSNSSSNLPLRTRASMKQLKQHNKLNGSGVSSSCVTSAQCTALVVVVRNTLRKRTTMLVLQPHKTVLLQVPPQQHTHNKTALLQSPPQNTVRVQLLVRVWLLARLHLALPLLHRCLCSKSQLPVLLHLLPQLHGQLHVAWASHSVLLLGMALSARVVLVVLPVVEVVL